MTYQPPRPDGPREGRAAVATSRSARAAFFLAGLLLTGIGIAGVILPLLPGTIFLIAAAACFARSSERLEGWLLNHPRYGPSIVAWRRDGAIPRRIKIVAVTSMVLSMGIVCLSPAPRWVDWLMALVIVGSAAFVMTRPERGRV